MFFCVVYLCWVCFGRLWFVILVRVSVVIVLIWWLMVRLLSVIVKVVWCGLLMLVYVFGLL